MTVLISKIEQIVLECLMVRGYSGAEAKKFISLLKGDNPPDDIIQQIDINFEKHFEKFNKYGMLLKEIKELQDRNVELKISLNEMEVDTELSIKNNNLFKRTVKLTLINLQREIQKAKATIIDKGLSKVEL